MNVNQQKLVIQSLDLHPIRNKCQQKDTAPQYAALADQQQAKDVTSVSSLPISDMDDV